MRGIFLSGLLISSLGCGANQQTYVPVHPFEIEIMRLTHCWAKYHGISVEVEFSEEKIEVQCSIPKQNREDVCYAAGWSSPSSGFITYSSRWLRGELGYIEESYLDWPAGHEVCHQTGLWGERDADNCNKESHKKHSCTGGE